MHTILQGNLYIECVTIHGSKHAIVQCTNFAYTDCEGGVTCKSALQQLYTA